MLYTIDFNRETDDDTLKSIGAKPYPIPYDTIHPPFEEYKIEIDKMEELEPILDRVRQIKGDYYNAIVGFDPPTIYLDNIV